MVATGTNTAISESEVATIGAATSRMASIVASLDFMPFSIFVATASTTTMASSTTIPMASTRPSRDSVLIEKPSSGKTAKVPISDTGTVECRDQGRTRILQEDVDDQDHQRHGLEQGDHDLADTGLDRLASYPERLT